MINNKLKTTTNIMNNGLMKRDMSLINTQKFCDEVLSKGVMSFPTNCSYSVNTPLVYSFPKEEQKESSEDVIIDLLIQLRACQNEQNAFITNSVLAKDQILDRIKSELSQATRLLGKSKVENIKNIINNNYTEQQFNQTINSIKDGLKKKI